MKLINYSIPFPEKFYKNNNGTFLNIWLKNVENINIFRMIVEMLSFSLLKYML